ncbi:MAG: tRNA (adenosine(37)-N6)-threonylcarbamoyltransferase complex dimerization subunit type 1 TsaB [Candidatus Dependentiae bacterium]|nr:tRNA (adenosine(37)-N6)-threonylcarbamoyltransferase complex dimerization subunit type 1 TsaB [Candidatus Dependentiae bacterium]
MQPYIILQYPYETIQIALCNQGQILTCVQEHKFNAIALTIPHINSILAEHNLTLKDLQCIGVNVGPGPYNTLRALLTMANGINFASGVALVGLSALDLLTAEHPNQNTLIIFQAFADHVFYQFNEQATKEQGACSVNELIKLITTKSSSFLVLGNGAQMYQKRLIEAAPNKLIFPDCIPAFNSLETLAAKTFEKNEANQFEPGYLKPIYFEDFAKK